MKHKPQHARKRTYRWKPWAKWLHLLSATFGLLIASGQTQVVIINFWGQMIYDFALAFVIYVAFVLVGGFLFTMIDES